jgi:S-adenosylmethionine:tRNA ribosyltransferase-isomerase
LPPELIAQAPAEQRDASRLMVVHRMTDSGGRMSDLPHSDIRHPTSDIHRRFTDFPSLVSPHDVIVVNDSRVIPARLLGLRRGGGAAEVLLIRREGASWIALVRPGARLKAGAHVSLGGGDRVAILDHLETGERRVQLVGEGGDEGVLARRGRIPLPPYITREDNDEDRVRYQTVYANEPGSVAAPTAGLHFTPGVMDAVRARGAVIAPVTLHVGPGTFRPVSDDDPLRHRMDEEAWSVPPETEARIRTARANGGKVWAVGTTAMRTLETAAREDRTVEAGSGWTSLFILPGYDFKVVDHLLTNFHLPKSTLLMLVCAFAGTERTMTAYAEAVEKGYRFYSYGDAMAIL